MGSRESEGAVSDDRVSVQWAEIGRSMGYGLPFLRLGRNQVRYRRRDVLAWLETRLHRSTAESR